MRANHVAQGAQDRAKARIVQPVAHDAPVAATGDQTFGAQWIADLSVSYKPDQQWAITVGADNVLDSYPDRSLFINSTSGMFPYSNYSPAGFNGAYWNGRVSFKW